MKKTEANFEAIVNQSSEGMGIADPEGTYIYVNPAFCAMMGYSEEELLGMTVFDVKAKSQDTGSFERSKTSEEGSPVQVVLQRKDGTEFISQVIGKMIVVDGKECVLGTVRDISERVRAAEALQAKNVELQAALSEIKQLSGLLPICAGCKKIRDDDGYWQQVETYIRNHSEVEFSHSICPACTRELYPEIRED